MVHHTALAGRVKHTIIQYETSIVGEEGREDGRRGEGGERRVGGEGEEGRGGWRERGYLPNKQVL